MKNWMLLAGLLTVAILGVALFALPAFGQEQATPPGQNQAVGCPGAGGIAGGPGMMGSYGMMGGGYMGLGNAVTLKRVADTLGLSSDQLTARLGQGETLAQIAQVQNVGTDAVVAAILAPHIEMMQVPVKYGYLTEAQAQTMFDQMRLSTEQAIARPQYGVNASQSTPNASGSNGGYRGGGMMGGNFGGGMMGGSTGGSGGMMGGWTPSSPNSGSTGYGFGGGMMGGPLGGRGGMMGW